MDGWREFFDLKIWEEAFRENGLDMRAYASRTYGIDDTLPWEHIKTGVSREWLEEEFRKSGFHAGGSLSSS